MIPNIVSAAIKVIKDNLSNLFIILISPYLYCYKLSIILYNTNLYKKEDFIKNLLNLV